jgi:23S rRNA pseudouridine2605 synthase
MKTEKLQKVLANLGLGSRREMERWIEQGRISVNRKIAKIGDRVDDKVKISVDGRLLKKEHNPKNETRVILYHKPVGEVCTRSDPEKRKTVFDNLPRLKNGRWIVVGRLDITTSGLLFFTNNGELANKLMHPSSQVEREYAVRILGEVDGLVLERLRKGVELEDGIARFNKIKFSGGAGANQWFHVVLNEGRNREVKRLWESQGVRVSRLTRIRFGNIYLPSSLKKGKWVELGEQDINLLLRQIKSN